jgi:hypothetical protein
VEDEVGDDALAVGDVGGERALARGVGAGDDEVAAAGEAVEAVAAVGSGARGGGARAGERDDDVARVAGAVDERAPAQRAAAGAVTSGEDEERERAVTNDVVDAGSCARPLLGRTSNPRLRARSNDLAHAPDAIQQI